AVAVQHLGRELGWEAPGGPVAAVHAPVGELQAVDRHAQGAFGHVDHRRAPALATQAVPERFALAVGLTYAAIVVTGRLDGAEIEAAVRARVRAGRERGPGRVVAQPRRAGQQPPTA